MKDLTQYVLSSHGVSDDGASLNPGNTNRNNCRTQIPVETQQQRNLDVLPGLLDLPNGQLSKLEIERYLKILALFYDKIIIPDSWLHCEGPISHYLREEIAQSSTGASASFVAENVFLQLLDAGVVVLALRGERPCQANGKPVGYDVYDVWKGRSQDHAGKSVDLGVYFSDPIKRMMILDPTEENEEMLQLLASHTRLFSDWTSPRVPISRLGYDQSADLHEWDTGFASTVKRLMVDSDLSMSPTVVLEDLTETGLSIDGAAIGRVQDFWDSLGGSLAALLRDGDHPNLGHGGRLRRGHYESLVARAFGLEKLSAYSQLHRALFEGPDITRNPLSAISGMNPSGVSPHALLGLTFLERISTIQEGLFSRHFNCSLSMPRFYSIDVMDEGLPASSNLCCGLGGFRNSKRVLWESPIPFEHIAIQDILELRSQHRDYFTFAAEAVVSENFWESNQELVTTLVRYLKAIAESCRFSKFSSSTISTATNQAVTAGVGFVFAQATGMSAVISILGMGAIVQWISENYKDSLSARVTNGVESKLRILLKQKRDQRRVDMTLRLLGIGEDLARFGTRPSDRKS